MATEFLTAVGREGIALFQREPQAAENLCAFLRGKGYRVYPVSDPREMILLTQQNTVDVAVVALGDDSEDLALLPALKEGVSAPPLIVLCDSATKTTIATVHAPTVVDQILVRPVPFARIIGEIERELQGRVCAREAGEGSALLFAKLLTDLWTERRTGRLQVIVDGVQTTIYLRDGVPMFAEQGSLEETLGRMLIRTGRITHQQFSQAVNLITERMVDNEQMRLGEALIELRILTADEVHQALRDQVRMKVLACFRAQRFHSDFRADPTFLDAVGDFSSPMQQVLLEGLKTVDPSHLANFLAPIQSRYPRLACPVEELVDSFGLGGREPSLLLAIRGDKTLGQLRDNSALDPIHASQVLTALVLGQAVTLHADGEIEQTSPATPQSPPQSAQGMRSPVRRGGSARLPEREQSEEESTLMALYLRVTGKADHDVLKVQQSATKDQIEAAYRKRTGEIEAVRPADESTVQAPVKRMLDAVSDHVRAARDRLLAGRGASTAAPAPQGTPDTKARLLAEEAYQRALAHYRDGDSKSALSEATVAAKLHSEELGYRMMFDWLAYRCASGKSREALGKRAFETARRLFGQEGTHPCANLALGHFLAHQGKRERARQHLLLALRNDQLGRSEIQQELRALDQRSNDGGPPKSRAAARKRDNEDG